MKSIKLHIFLFCFFIVCASSAHAQNKSFLSGKDLVKGITIDDAFFSAPYIDVDEWRDKPVRHRYVHGGFKGRNTRFSFYFPPKEQYEGRFFQYITPVPDNENISQGSEGEEDKISFAVQSGAYFIETNGGGEDGNPMSGGNGIFGAFGANAACANYSRTVAAEMYGAHRTYGYAFGGSGGAFRTIGGFEHTVGVWDGVVPYVPGSPMAIPNVFCIRMHAMRVLQDKFPQILDALEPGGSGNMYEGLNVEEREALLEATKMGFPPKSWFGYKTMGVHGFSALYQGVKMADKSYFEDFWTKPGYLGANPPQSLIDARIQHKTKIKKVITASDAAQYGIKMEFMAGRARGTAEAAYQVLENKAKELPIAFQLESAPKEVQFLGGELIINSGDSKGAIFELKSINGDVIVLGAVSNTTQLAKMKAGDDIQVDNSNYLAAQTYHRHQVPGPDYPEWDQFRDFEGKPAFPQRRMLIGPLFYSAITAGGYTGKFNGKMILLSNLWDREAYPWQSDWYLNFVKKNMGDSAKDHIVLWYTDHALHGDLSAQEDPTLTVSYLGVLQQALRDLSVWVEKGIVPPSTSNYKIVDGQVVVPPTANERKGIQSVVNLKVNGGEHADIASGGTVTFTAEIGVPENTGKVVALEWDFEGAKDFAVSDKVKENDGNLSITSTHTFSKPGTYFPTLRVVSQRKGDSQTPFARIQNLGRVRVVVK